MEFGNLKIEQLKTGLIYIIKLPNYQIATFALN